MFSLTGAIFTEEQRSGPIETAFKYAIQTINEGTDILPNITLEYDIRYVHRDDSFHTAKNVCGQLRRGVVAILGPSDPLLGPHVQSICDAVDVPHLEARVGEAAGGAAGLSVNLHPAHGELASAYGDLIGFLNWSRMAVVYEDNAGLLQLQTLVGTPPGADMEVYIRQADPADYRHVLSDIKNKNIFNVIVDTRTESIPLFLRADTETFDLEDFRYNLVNMTAFRLVASSQPAVRRTVTRMAAFQPVGVGPVHPRGVLQVRLDGLTGPVELTEGRRTGVRLELLKLADRGGMRPVGRWSRRHGITITNRTAFFGTGRPNVTLLVTTILERPFVMVKSGSNLTGNARFEGFCVDLLERVAKATGFQYQIELAPEGNFGTRDPVTGEWSGLVRQLIDKKADLAVASMTINYDRESVIDFTKPFMNLGISILFKVPKSQPTRLFSFMNPLAVEIWLYVMAAYVIVSFTMFVMARFSPYEWNNPHPCFDDNDVVENQFSVSNSFWFITGTLLRQGSGLNPKAASTRIVGSIWWFFTLIIISSYTANLAAFLTVERTSTNIESAADLANQEEIEYGTLEGGSTMTFFRDSKIDTYRKMWRFMESRRQSVLVSSYQEGVQRVRQGNYAYLMESTTLDYIVQRDCNLTQVGGLLDSKGYGIATPAGEDGNPYITALPTGSVWRDRMSLAILDLQESGVIQMLYNKWWKDTGDVCNRDEKKSDSKASELGIENIGKKRIVYVHVTYVTYILSSKGGVFVVLLCGLALAMIVAVLEFCWNSKKNAQTDRVSVRFWRQTTGSFGYLP
ncbi:Glutamate receptor ionotropic, kainate 2 [Amphibalanus amphitrite]|uniref:Glutamate receptor ionotropic, kainate 2 n=1 Tax=Amphibalanus amphitrite TaxID=1232801 RepID=A0A6A4W136_AMPAM|nr:Glutamate receptor ionotropic, kainate 2 [Amphibalanus amphitrite]